MAKAKNKKNPMDVCVMIIRALYRVSASQGDCTFVNPAEASPAYKAVQLKATQLRAALLEQVRQDVQRCLTP